jgi:hypothetical protein
MLLRRLHNGQLQVAQPLGVIVDQGVEEGASRRWAA